MGPDPRLPVPVPAGVRNPPLVGAPLPWPEFLLSTFRDCPATLHPLLSRMWLCALGAAGGGARKAIKGVLFDCRMCGQCVLGATGMSCSDELSEESPKRTMRPACGRTALRGPARNEMRVVGGGRREARGSAAVMLH